MAKFEHFQKSCQANEQVGLVGAFIHGVLDDLLTSVKLLLIGMMNPSGNAFRQAIEGICMTIMCAHEGALIINGKEQLYWALVEGNSDDARGHHRAVCQLRANADRFGLDAKGTEILHEALNAHHAPSHAGRLAIAHRVELAKGRKAWFGGHFDPDKIDGYRAEMHQRRNGALWAGELIDVLWPKVERYRMRPAPRARWPGDDRPHQRRSALYHREMASDIAPIWAFGEAFDVGVSALLGKCCPQAKRGVIALVLRGAAFEHGVKPAPAVGSRAHGQHASAVPPALRDGRTRRVDRTRCYRPVDRAFTAPAGAPAGTHEELIKGPPIASMLLTFARYAPHVAAEFSKLAAARRSHASVLNQLIPTFLTY